MKKSLLAVSSFVFFFLFSTYLFANPPIYIAFLWHMHQPIYWPGETITQTESAGHYSFDVEQVFLDRTGPYTTYPTDAIEAGINRGLGHLGASVSFTGSLMENLDNLEANGVGFSGWTSRWIQGRGYTTSLGNPRLDMIGFSYYHSLNGLIDYNDIRRQIQLHKLSVAKHFGTSVPYSKGFFPAETAFSPRMIPALVDEGIQWAIIDNIHYDRSCKGYPWNSGGNLYEPNPSDQRNPNPNDWVSLTNVWAPTQVSGGFGHRPHYVQYTDPSTGQTKKIITVPGDRYMGNEDARGGFGALQYDSVMSQLASYNTDAAHPLLIVLHHDGDNYGGGTDSYYRSNFQNFVSWLQANPSRFVCTTIQDYIDMFPPDTTDIIHIEDGSWSGADNGDPEFLKWNGDPDTSGYSADRNSWGVIVAGKNRVETAKQINPTSSNSSSAYANFVVGEASDYWYWEPNPTTWDGHPTRACNLATPFADAVIGGGSADSTGPTIYLPQREPYNAGGTEWSIAKSTTFQVWTYVYDVSGLNAVNLKYRADYDGVISSENETYAEGAGVSGWTTVAMSSVYRIPETSVTPNYKAWEYSAYIPGILTTEMDYYVEATDSKSFVSRSAIRHITLGSTGGGGSGGLSTFWIPSVPTTGQNFSVYYDPVAGALPDSTNPVYIHLGYNHWATVIAPNPAMTYDSTTGYWRYDLVIPSNVTTIDFVFASIPGTSGGSWDNNNGQDWHVPIPSESISTTTTSFVLDGNLDPSAQLIATSSNSTLHLYAAWNGIQLYLATEKASGGNDRFIILAQSTAVFSMATAIWAKSGQVMQYNAFIGNENDNNWSGWFNSSGSPSSWSYATTYSSNGSYLEGLIQIQSLFGSIPSSVYLAAASYPTAASTSLANQAPPGNSDANLDASEFVQFMLNVVPVDSWELYGSILESKK